MSTENIKSPIPFFDSTSLFDSPVYLSPSIYDSPVYLSPSSSIYDSPKYYSRTYYPPVPFVFSRPSTYNTIENDPDARLEIIKSFHHLLGEWLMTDLKHILEKVLGSSGRDPENIKHKIGHIKKNMLTLTDMAKILSGINKESKIRWIDLPHKKSMVRKIIEKYLMDKITKH